MIRRIAASVPFALMLLLPLAASAHEHATYKIGNAYYQIVIGSLNEPVAVDDKTGIDLTVSKCYSSACTATMGPDGDMDGPAGKPVTGLDQTLKAQLIAGGVTKDVTLSPQWGKDGAYTAAFYPTVATTLSYRFTGTIDGTPVDLTYSCIPEGTTKAADNTTPVKLTDSVTQTMVGGGFGCPVEKESLGFPEASASLVALKKEAGAGAVPWAGVLLGLLGTALGTAALSGKKKSGS